MRVATARREQTGPTVEQVKHVVALMPAESAIQRSAARIRTIFRDAFTGAGLPYFNPHSFRNTLVRLGQSVCQTPEVFKAWSQNLGHDKVLTTFSELWPGSSSTVAFRLAGAEGDIRRLCPQSTCSSSITGQTFLDKIG